MTVIHNQITPKTQKFIWILRKVRIPLGILQITTLGYLKAVGLYQVVIVTLHSLEEVLVKTICIYCTHFISLQYMLYMKSLNESSSI